MAELDHARVRVDDDEYYTRLDFQPLEKAIPVQDAWLNLMFDTLKSRNGLEVHNLQELKNRATGPQFPCSRRISTEFRVGIFRER